MSQQATMPDGAWFQNYEKRPHPWPGFEWMTPALTYPDVAAAVEFYADTLGFIPIFTLPPAEDGHLPFARMRYRGINFTLNAPSFEPDVPSPTDSAPATMAFYLYVDDVPAAVAATVEAGATVLIAPREEFWGDLRARVRDPFGYVWDLAQPAIDS